MTPEETTMLRDIWNWVNRQPPRAAEPPTPTERPHAIWNKAEQVARLKFKAHQSSAMTGETSSYEGFLKEEILSALSQLSEPGREARDAALEEAAKAIEPDPYTRTRTQYGDGFQAGRDSAAERIRELKEKPSGAKEERETRDAVLEAISKAGAFSAEIPCAVTVHFEYGPDAWDLLHSLHALKSFLGSRLQK